MRHLLSLLVLSALSALFRPADLTAATDTRPLVSPVFSDHMVLQRDRLNRLWGWAAPGQEVRVELGGTVARAQATADGRWQVELTPPPVGGPYTIKIVGPQTVELHDVLVGDVWLFGGQSNMAFGLRGMTGGDAEAAAATHPQIRLLRVPEKVAYDQGGLPAGDWQVCSPATVSAGGNGGFSAVAYLFGLRLHTELGVPIGLIQDCIGGSPAESWMSREALQRFPEFAKGLEEITRLKNRGGPAYGNYIMHWYDEFDRGAQGATWAAEAFDDTTWKQVPVPGQWHELGAGDGPAVYWFRRELTLPDPLPAGPAKIRLGVVEKMDSTYLNGQWIGASSWVENPRVYPVADGILRPGRNLVAVRVCKLQPNGGFQSPAAALVLELGDGRTIPLAGPWKGALSVDARPPHSLPLGYENYPTMPTVLYQGMLAPLAPLALRGVVWYQGEANFTRAYQYRSLLPALIADWRALFRQADLPFYIVSLPAFLPRRTTPGDDGWAELREAQALTVRTVPHTALAVTVDTGDANDIHPKEKRPVAQRLALCALHDTYGRDLVCAGPTFTTMEPLPGGALRLHFAHTDGGLVNQGEKLAEFAVAGADRKWFWAEAHIEGDTVVVASPQVPQPVAVRYAWQANPAATLFNGAGLPATPFRSDDWPISTQLPRPDTGRCPLTPPPSPSTK